MVLYEVIPTKMQGSGSYFKGRAGQTLARFRLVYLGANGTWYLADADAVATMSQFNLLVHRYPIEATSNTTKQSNAQIELGT